MFLSLSRSLSLSVCAMIVVVGVSSLVVVNIFFWERFHCVFYYVFVLCVSRFLFDVLGLRCSVSFVCLFFLF